MASRPLRIFRTASAAARCVPFNVLRRSAEVAGAEVGPRLMEDKAEQLQRHLHRADPSLDDDDGRAAARRGFGSYGRYWIESFRLPSRPPVDVDRGFSVYGYDRVEAALADGTGPILVLPHLGGWEWAAAWLGRTVGVEVAAVVERLEPDDVFEWFVDLRSAYGIDVIPLGNEALPRLVKAIKDRKIVCLLSDRDLGGNGIEVEFFGETTTLPAGPALLARRTGAPLLPTAVYFRGRGRVGWVDEAIRADESLSLRADIARMTQALATAMESLIRAAPDQWHLLEPNWPSDRLPEAMSGAAPDAGSDTRAD
ncbi:MAG: phosphatidylinositol mannoside acyltransferase [Actinomycetota bacterium]